MPHDFTIHALTTCCTPTGSECPERGEEGRREGVKEGGSEGGMEGTFSLFHFDQYS